MRVNLVPFPENLNECGIMRGDLMKELGWTAVRSVTYLAAGDKKQVRGYVHDARTSSLSQRERS